MALSYLTQISRLLRVQRVAAQPRRSANGWKYGVSSPAMKQLDRYCEPYPPPPPPGPLQKVTILGGASPVGRIASLFLKQQNLIQYLALYDDCNVAGYAHDLAHIDTSTAVEAYTGRLTLKAALERSAVVLVCCGYQPFQCCCSSGIVIDELFLCNARIVHSYIVAISEYCPGAIVCLQTPPVDCIFTFSKYIMKKHKVYDKRRLLGVNALAAMRANKLYCDLENKDPTKSYCPCVGGTSGSTVVPVFSCMDRFICQEPGDIETATDLVRNADQLVVDAKCHSEGLGALLSTGFSTARFIVNAMKGVFGGKEGGFIDSALVEQDNPESCFGMKYCATPLSLGSDGIRSYLIPKLNPNEMELLENSKEDLRLFLNMGKIRAEGECDFGGVKCVELQRANKMTS